MRIAVVGDVHERWSARDCDAIDALGYDRVLFVGDLADRLHLRTLRVARELARLRTPALLIPGNHDATSPLGILLEGLHRGTRRPALAARMQRRLDALRAALGPVELAGYSLHPHPEHGVTIVGARPHAMDGRRLSFAPTLEARFGVDSLAGSAARLRALVDAAEGALVFLAHNGARGLGGGADGPFVMRRGLDGTDLVRSVGRMWRREPAGIDLGDPDLAEALAWARSRGRTVAAVVAGHMHHRGTRRWAVEQDGVLHVNAARVPRVEGGAGHHVALEIDAAGRATASEVWA